ncbi:MAG: hypothetical protein JWO33_999 [Caulobacteraceae bacterium]|nr:hypothetical protein [Caulobacteraceae bacterium]
MTRIRQDQASSTSRFRLVDFARVADAALRASAAVVDGLLPEGHRQGAEWVARNPRRPDQRAGSFKVNLNTGKWSDFATGDKGGDLISLAAFVTDLPQREAAIRLAESLGVEPYQGSR